MNMLLKFLAQLILYLHLISGIAQGESPVGKSNWVLAELGGGVQGAEVGHYFGDNLGLSAGWLRTRWSHPWKGQDPETFTDTFRTMLRFSEGFFRIGLGSAYRNTQGSARCDKYTLREGEKISWQMTSVDVVGDVGLLFSSPRFLVGFTIVAAGRQVQRSSAKIKTVLNLSEKDLSRIEEELKTDTSHGLSLLLGLNF